MVNQAELLKILIANQKISQEQADDIAAQAAEEDRMIEDVIAKLRLVDMEEVVKIKAGMYGVDYAEFFEKEISSDILNIIPAEVAENYRAICFEIDNKTMKIGIVDPDNLKAKEAIDFLGKKKNLSVGYFLISFASFEHAYKRYKTIGTEVTTALKAKEEEEKELIEIKDREIDKAELAEVVKSAPVTKIVSVIIRHAIEGGASDIHIEPLLRETRVRYRVDGVLHTSLVLPKNIHYAVVARVKVLTGLKLDETRIPQEGRIRLLIDNKEVDCRVSIIPLVDDEKVVMRILDVTKGAPTLKELGFVEHELRVIQRGAKKTHGMFLITGPTGSGKSTTLFSILNILNKEGVNISTLEDPVEYYIQGIAQSQIRPALGYTFASGLRTMLRQDPDIMMVGEIRDNETAELAIHSALTGHLVLSTLHTIDALGAIPRLLDMGVEPFLLASTLDGIVAQRLVRRICGHCKTRVSVPDDIMSDVQKQLQAVDESLIKARFPEYNLNNVVFYKGEGCARCANTGYTGRVAIAEALEVTSEIKKIINEKRGIIDADYIKKKQHFISMNQDGLIKAMQGVTTVEEVMRVINE